jgi:hypothetical protein
VPGRPTSSVPARGWGTCEAGESGHDERLLVESTEPLREPLNHFLVLGVNMPTEYQATVTVKGWRKHRCEHCGERFAYPLRRTVAATAGTGWTGSDDDAVREAKRAASAGAEDELRSGFECVPCLNCGRFQAEMVEELGRRKVKSKTLLLYACGGLALATGGLAAIVTAAMMGAPDKNNTGLPLVITVVAWGAVVPFVLGTGAMFLLRRSARAAFDPYEGKSEEFWKRQARELGAVAPDELKAIEDRRRAAEEADIASQADLNFEADAKKPPRPPGANGGKPPAPPAPVRRSPEPPPAEKNPFDFS